jgi:type III secretion protein C
MKTMTNKRLQTLFNSALAGLLLFSIPHTALSAEEEEQEEGVLPFLTNHAGYSINFHEVPVIEFIRFVSKISEANFIYDVKDLAFNISLSTGRSVHSDKIVGALIQLLRVHGLTVNQQADYYVIHRIDEEGVAGEGGKSFSNLTASLNPLLGSHSLKDEYEFLSYKLQYHDGGEIEEALKKIGADLKLQPEAPVKLINAIHSLQWVKATNSLLCSADPETLASLRQLIQSVDVPLRQVFIEVLVIETDAKKGMEFGLQWAAGGQFHNKVGFGMGNFQGGHGNGGSFAQAMQGSGPSNTPSGLSQFPLVPGFDLGVIGDIIMHRGKSFFTLGSLVSAIQNDGQSTIVLNQKIITQDNKNSTIFVGDNIPFTGSVVQTIGQSQQTSANIEYRDVGVSLSITPRLGEGDVITLDINEEITESLDHDMSLNNNSVNGIRTTKTNMSTHVHVPDKHFLVLSGMIRNHKSRFKTGVPCLGGLPVVGALFSKTREGSEKRNVVIFVRPHIIHSIADYEKLTQQQQESFQAQSNAKDFSEGVELVNPKE